MLRAELRRIEKTDARSLSPDEIRKLREACRGDWTFALVEMALATGPSGEATEEREVATVPPAAIRARSAAVPQGTAAGTPQAFRDRLQRPGFDLLRTERRPPPAGPHLSSHRSQNAQSGDQRRQHAHAPAHARVKPALERRSPARRLSPSRSCRCQRYSPHLFGRTARRCPAGRRCLG